MGRTRAAAPGGLSLNFCFSIRKAAIALMNKEQQLQVPTPKGSFFSGSRRRKRQSKHLANYSTG
jgi:hypothetical protein